MTWQDVLYQAFRKCGQMRPGYVPQAELLTDGLSECAALYDGWNAERTLNYTVPDYIYPISGATSLSGIYGTGIQWSIGPRFTFSAVLISGSTTATVADTQGLNIGQAISGTGIATGTKITAISVNASITLSIAATSSVTSTVTVTASFTGPRPESIIRMNLYMTSASPSQPTRIPLAPVSAEQWANIAVLQLTPINVTTVFYYEPQYPQGVINVWPPLNGNSLEIFTWGFLTPPTALTTAFMAPPGYQDAIVWSLAERLWPLCTQAQMVNQVSHQWVCGKAAEARAKVRRVNAPSPRLASDFGKGRPGAGGCDWGLLLTGRPY